MVCLVARYISPKIYSCAHCCQKLNALRRKKGSLSPRRAGSANTPDPVFSPYLPTSADLCRDIPGCSHFVRPCFREATLPKNDLYLIFGIIYLTTGSKVVEHRSLWKWVNIFISLHLFNQKEKHPGGNMARRFGHMKFSSTWFCLANLNRLMQIPLTLNSMWSCKNHALP